MEKSLSDREFSSRHVYSRSASLCFNEVIARSGRPTIEVHAAQSVPDGGRYLWSEKIAFQLSHSELAQLCSVFCHPGPTLRFVHGLKELAVAYQTPRILISVREGPKTLRVPIERGDQHVIRMLLLNQLHRLDAGHPDLLLFSLAKLAEDLSEP